MSRPRSMPPKRARSSPPRGTSPSADALASPRSLAPGQDAYADLLRDTRGLRREQANLREQWVAKLPLDRRDDALFELEILLKGLACFANPRNHTGPPRRVAIVAQDYRETMVLAREGMHRIVKLCRTLLAEQEERAFVFQRYLEMLLPDDNARTRLAGAGAREDTPEESLFLLRHGMTNLLEVTGGVARLPRVPFRLFYATLSIAHREVAQSSFFNPLVALEFRPEFDRITNPRVLELMRDVHGERARGLVALTFLSLFRMLRYLTLLEHTAREPRPSGLVFLILSVLRSDARALTDHLRKHAGRRLAESYERELFRVPASEIRKRYDELAEEAHRLVVIKSTLSGIAANLRLELRRAFEHDLPAPDGAASSEAVRVAVGSVITNLRPALQNAVLVLGKALGTRLDEHGVFDDHTARRMLSDRLRRDVWMFAQIVRAFGAKARAAPSREERWAGASSIEFVREFLSYFHAMGYPLLRAADYPRFDAFVEALSDLDKTDLLDPDRLERAVGEADRFHAFLSELFEQIGLRDELRDMPFDRRAAATSLKLYLGD